MRLNVLFINLATFWVYCGAQGPTTAKSPDGPAGPSAKPPAGPPAGPPGGASAGPPFGPPSKAETTDEYKESSYDRLPTIPEDEIEEALNVGGDKVSPMDYIFAPFNIQNWYPDGMNLGYNEYCIEQYIRCALSSVYPHSNCAHYWYHNYWWRYFWSACAYRMDGCRRRFRLFHFHYIEQVLPVLNARDNIPINLYRHLCTLQPNYA